LETRKRKTQKKGRPTIIDVGEEAGVSHITVSRVLRNPSLVSEKLTKRVHDAMRTLGYQHNFIAGALASTHTPIVPIIVPQLSNAMFTSLIQEATNTLSPHGYQVLLGSSYFSRQQEDKLLRTFLGWSPVGVILAGARISNQARDWLKAAEIPVAQVIHLYKNQINISVGCDQRQAGYELAGFLIKKGYRRFAFAGTRLNHDIRAKMRLQGLSKALEEDGLEPPLLLDAGDKTTSYITGRYLGSQALKVRPKIELVFAAGDILAVGAMQEMHSQGVKIPEDMGVCGFGGLDIAQVIYPALTTVQANLGYIGKRAAELLMTQIDRKLTPIQEDVGFTIVPGEST
jgi:LacI family gluconate utilization system Gnt-I transcriptional repressor